MPKVTDTLKRIIADQEARIITGQEAVVRTLEEVRRQVAAELLTTPMDSFSAYRLQQTLAAIDGHLATWASGARSILSSGLNDAWSAGAEQLPALSGAARKGLGQFGISTDVLDQLQAFSWGKINGVAGEAATKIKAELTLGMLGQKSSQEVALAIVGELPESLPMIKGRNVFKSISERAEVITGTELGRAFSMASQKSLEAGSDSLPGLQKMWLHAGHPRVGREIHLLMHGQTREIDKPFYKAPGGYGVQFPRDPNAPISEVIRCGCTHVPHHPDWGTAQDFADVFDARQHKLWTEAR
jgi:hypothetical protein